MLKSRLKALLGGSLILLAATVAPVQAGQHAAYEFMAFGDMPYRIPQDETLLTDMITRMNAERPAFVVNVGDIKNGGTLCSEENYEKMAGVFRTIDAPLLYTPGDNEWTDCQRPACGGYNPTERLQALRKVFFTQSKTFEKKLPVSHQSDMKEFEPYVENARWVIGPVQYLTVHNVGSNNSMIPGEGRLEEYTERNRANLHWLHETFAKAREEKRRGIVVFMHADPFLPPEQGATESGFTDFLQALEDETHQSQMEVLLIHGDSHIYRIDKPFIDMNTYAIRTDITRVIVFASPNINAVKVEVTPKGKSLFTIRPLLQ